MQKQEQINKKANALKRIGEKNTLKVISPKIAKIPTKNLAPILTIPPVPQATTVATVSQVANIEKTISAPTNIQ